MKKKPILIAIIIVTIAAVIPIPSYFIARWVFNTYFEKWGEKLISLEKRGLLSREFGAAWQYILDDEAMEKEAEEFTDQHNTSSGDSIVIVDGIAVKDYPSLGIVRRLNEVDEYSNTIEIVDRKQRRIALIQTDHTRGKLDEFPPVLIKALIAAEDENFYENSLGFEFKSFVRAFLYATGESIITFSKVVPKGTSTITQQVAKLFVSHLDESGHRKVSRSVDRKIRELRIAAALRKVYTPQEILEVYVNHCVASDYGLIGFKDIARGLLGKDLGALSDAECIYLARMIKWGRNIRSKIINQCKIDMSRMGTALGWTEQYQNDVLDALDTINFVKPRQIQTDYGHLVDLANEFWLKYIQKTGEDSAQLYQTMDIINPNSLIRKKGAVTIQLTIDLALQQYLQQLVDNRGYGTDTTINTDIRIGSYGEDIVRRNRPRDTLRLISIIDTASSFSEPRAQFQTILQKGDTLVTNIRYQRKDNTTWRKSIYYYTRRRTKVDGQYFSYLILDSKTGKILAYYSKDKIGSRLACLLKNKVPNGSSTAKPIINALNFDLGIFAPYAMWTDSVAVTEEVAWKRDLLHTPQGIEVAFLNSAVPGKPYIVHNHDYIIEGCHYIFDHLATSNNIFGVESIYRLNKKIFDAHGTIIPGSFPFVQFFYRINALNRMKENFRSKTITGVRIYKELARIVGADSDSMMAYGRRIPVSDRMYSVALGTLEMTLLEQAHMFNMLYDNNLIENPSAHPSLAIEKIVMNDVTINTSDRDTVKQYHPFADLNNIRPTYLGMHKRLISNRWDGLQNYDIAYTPDIFGDFTTSKTYSADAHMIKESLSNYAKSGTTDDILRPFNADVTSNRRTNYGLWNATIRVDLGKLSDSSYSDIRDITIACIGECNQQYTGARDGKTLHKFVSRDLLKKAGVPVSDGFYKHYENYLVTVTPDSLKTCNECCDQEETLSVEQQQPDSSESETDQTENEWDW